MKRDMTRRAAVALIAALALAVAAGAKTVKVQGFPAGSQDPEVLNAGLPATEYGYHPSDDSSWGESWSMQAANAAGDYVYVLMSVSNYHPFHQHAGTVDIFYCKASGEKHKSHGEFLSDKVRADPAKVQVDIGGHTFSGAHPTYSLHVRFPDLAADLTFRVPTPDLRLGQDFLRFGARGERLWNLTILGPRAQVAGAIAVNGRTIPFSGLGYMDHGWSTEKLYKFSRTWYVLRLVQDDFSLNAVQMNFRDGYDPRTTQAIYITEGDRVIANSGALRLVPSGGKREERSGVLLPESYAVSYESGGTKVAGMLKMTRLVEGLNVLDQLSPVLRKVISALVVDPWQFRFAGEADLTVTRDGTTRHVTGPVVGEVHSYK